MIWRWPALPAIPERATGWSVTGALSRSATGQLALRARRDSGAITAARAAASRSGLRGDNLDATIEAIAINAKAAGLPPQNDDDEPVPLVAPGEDLAHETEWLIKVSRKFARLPIIRQN